MTEYYVMALNEFGQVVHCAKIEQFSGKSTEEAKQEFEEQLKQTEGFLEILNSIFLNRITKDQIKLVQIVS